MSKTEHSLSAYGSFVGDCIDDNHPEQSSLFLISFELKDGTWHRRWLESLQGISVRKGVKVLLVRPENAPDPIIVGAFGVTEPKTTAADFEVRPNNVIALHGNAPIQVVTHDGRKLVEIGKGKDGPTIRICQKDAILSLPGKLEIIAGELELKSTKGDVRIDAEQEVVVQGDLIRLN